MAFLKGLINKCSTWAFYNTSIVVVIIGTSFSTGSSSKTSFTVALLIFYRINLSINANSLSVTLPGALHKLLTKFCEVRWATDTSDIICWRLKFLIWLCTSPICFSIRHKNRLIVLRTISLKAWPSQGSFQDLWGKISIKTPTVVSKIHYKWIKLSFWVSTIEIVSNMIHRASIWVPRILTIT